MRIPFHFCNVNVLLTAGNLGAKSAVSAQALSFSVELNLTYYLVKYPLLKSCRYAIRF